MYIFYDLETSDLDKNFSQILQIGLIYADKDLNIIEEKEITCKRSPWILPSPSALLITGFAPEQLEKNKNSQFDLLTELEKWLNEKKWPLIFAGYNSTKFDDPFLQNCRHQNLQEPFISSMSKKWGDERNSKIDIITMVKAVAIFAPEILTLNEKNTYGTKSMALGIVCRQNNINLSEEAAHDAIADVRATLDLAKKIKSEAPKVWEQMMTMRSKDKVDYFLKENPVFGYSYAPRRGQFISDNIIATSIAQAANYANEQIVFDLSFDPAEYINKSIEELTELMKVESDEHVTHPLRIVKKNQQPVLMPFDMSGTITPDNIDEDTLKQRAEMISKNPVFQKNVAIAADKARPVFENGTEPEQQMFEFIDKAHKKDLQMWINEFHAGNWKERQETVQDFPKRFKLALEKQPSIKRFMSFAMRIIYADAPEVMTENMQQKYSLALLKRLSDTNTDVPWMTFEKVRNQLNEVVELRDKGEERWKNITDKQVEDLRSYYLSIADNLLSITAKNDNNKTSGKSNNNQQKPSP